MEIDNPMALFEDDELREDFAVQSFKELRAAEVSTCWAPPGYNKLVAEDPQVIPSKGGISCALMGDDGKTCAEIFATDALMENHVAMDNRNKILQLECKLKS